MRLSKWLLILCTAAVIAIIAFFAVRKHDSCAYIRLSGLTFSDLKDTIVIGQNGNIAFNEGQVDTAYLKIVSTSTGYYWKTNHPAYIKFNDSVNFNKHLVSVGDVIYYGNAKLTSQDLEERLKGYLARSEYLGLSKTGQTYFALKDVFSEKDEMPDTKSHGYKRQGSLLYYDQQAKAFQIILLDSLSSLVKGDQTYHTLLSGTIQGDNLKIEVIDPQSGYFISGKNPLYHNRNINVSTVRTEWQSSHLLLRKDEVNNSIKVFFSQPLVIMLDQPTIDTMIARTHAETIQIAQEAYLMDKKTFYFEKFSALFDHSLFSVQQANKEGSPKKITFNEHQSEGNISNRSMPLASSFDFNIPSDIQPAVEVFGNYSYVTSAQMLIPYAALIIVFVVSMILVGWLTNEDRYLYWRYIRITPKDAQTPVDFESIVIDVDSENNTFQFLRMPVFYFVLILMCFKLVITEKLVFTHPFFPHLFFIAFFMAITTPVFLAYFLIRNSWSMPALRSARFLKGIPSRILFSAMLLIIIVGIYTISWLLVGDRFYGEYFKMYDVSYSFKGIMELLHNTALRKDKFFQIPMVIAATPFFLLIYDLVSWPVYSIFDSRKVDNKWFDLFRSIDGLLVLMAGMAIFSKSATILHVAVTVVLLFYFKTLTGKAPVPKASNKQTTPKTRRYWPKLIWAIIVLIGLSVVKIAGDQGILINYFLVMGFAAFMTMILLLGRTFEDGLLVFFKLVVLPFIPVLVFVSLALLYSAIHNPKVDDLDRSIRRVNTIINKNKALETGGKQYLSDLQFLEIARINAIDDIKKPSFKFANRDRPLHPFVSKGLYPVIINDLNPLTWLDYGGWAFVMVLLLSWLLLFLNRQRIWEADFMIDNDNLEQDTFDLVQLLRFVPLLIIISNSLWMLLSLFNIVFFTGRIINGFGVDSIADWFELIAFSALMGMVIFENAKPVRSYVK